MRLISDSSKPLECRYNERSLESPGKLTTWSSLGKSNNTPPCSNTTSFQHTPPTPVLWQSRNREELNNNGEIRKSKSLPEPEATKDLVNTFMRGRSPQASGCAAASETTSTTPTTTNVVENDDLTEIPMMRSKDTVNQFLKTNSRLTSIEEQAEGGKYIWNFIFQVTLCTLFGHVKTIFGQLKSQKIMC